MLVLYRLLAGGHYIVAARRGALQCVNRILRFALELLRELPAFRESGSSCDSWLLVLAGLVEPLND